MGLFLVLQANTGTRLIGNAEAVSKNLMTIFNNIAKTSLVALLNSQSNEINKIAEASNGISRQVNLLVLNANNASMKIEKSTSFQSDKMVEIETAMAKLSMLSKELKALLKH